MRLWSIHPSHLDPQGLVAHWRETLLAQAVLHGETKGYKNHPQLQRFKEVPEPKWAIATYLQGIHLEATARGYRFDGSKIHPHEPVARIPVTSGQVRYEWEHLLRKLERRNPALFEQAQHLDTPQLHPLFTLIDGDIEPWEVLNTTSSKS